MKCPIHDEELRDEYYTGFCLKCLKHYKRCLKTQYMNSCDKLYRHEGCHEDKKGHQWDLEDENKI